MRQPRGRGGGGPAGPWRYLLAASRGGIVSTGEPQRADGAGAGPALELRPTAERMGPESQQAK